MSVHRIKLLLFIKRKSSDIGNEAVILIKEFQWKRFYRPV